MSSKSYPKLNQSVEICKLIAACMIIFCHHIVASGKGDAVMECLSRFGVPVFFAISGYYSHGIDDAHIVKRTIHMFKIFIISTLIYMCVESFLAPVSSGMSAFEYLRNCLSVQNLAQLVIMNENPFAPHLWYLSAMLTVYIIFGLIQSSCARAIMWIISLCT